MNYQHLGWLPIFHIETWETSMYTPMHQNHPMELVLTFASVMVQGVYVLDVWVAWKGAADAIR